MSHLTITTVTDRQFAALAAGAARRTSRVYRWADGGLSVPTLRSLAERGWATLVYGPVQERSGAARVTITGAALTSAGVNAYRRFAAERGVTPVEAGPVVEPAGKPAHVTAVDKADPFAVLGGADDRVGRLLARYGVDREADDGGEYGEYLGGQ